MKNKATVIGAGLGGLAAACLLAGRDYSVSVFEKNNKPGGKMQQVWAEGYRFDTGPSLLTMPFILEKLFKTCGEEMAEYLELTEPTPLCRYFYHDGVIFDNYSEDERTVDQIKNFAPEDADAYAIFLERSKELYEKTSDSFLYNPLYQFSDLKNLKISDFFGIDAFSTVSEKVDAHFGSPYMRKFFKRFTTYNGSSPYQTPATLNVIPHVELNQGGYYVKGGLYRIALALQQLAEELGVQFHFNSPVRSIHVKDGEANKIILKNGSEFQPGILFSNADATDTILNLMPGHSISNRKKKRQKSLEPSCSGFVMLLGCTKKWDILRHHNIFFSSGYKKEFSDIFNENKMPEDPTIYVANTSYTDKNDAPEGGSNLFVLINAPYVTGSLDWETFKHKYSEFVIRELENRGLEGLKKSIEYTETITPYTFLNKYGSNRGSIYGTSSNSKLSAFIRPRNKLRGFENIYLVGGSTHPGGGIPLVIQSAFNAMKILSRN